MSKNWKKYTLKEVTSKIGSGSTPRGGDSAYINEGISLIRSQNVLDFIFSKAGLAHITEEQAHELRSVTIEKNDVLVNITGDSVARACQVPDEIIPARVNQHVAIVRANTELLHPRYLLYYLLQQSSKANLLSLSSSGATRKALTKVMLEEFEINLPSISEQKVIAEILSALDDKIELNFKTCKTLEEMTNELYKHWFVDFGPFQNYEFVESELGNIPKGWSLKRLEELVTKLGDGLHGTPNFNDDGEYYFINGNNLSNGRILIKDETKRVSSEEYKKYKKELNDRTLFVSINGTIGNIAAYGGEKIVLGKSACYFNIKEDVSKEFVKRVISSNYFINYIESAFTGSVIKNISLKTMRELPIIVPPPSEQQKFQNIVNSLTASQEALHQENKTLTQLRNTLLTKLISGEVQVKNAVKKVKEVI